MTDIFEIQKDINDRYYNGEWICEISVKLDIPMKEVLTHLNDFRRQIYPYDTYEEWSYWQDHTE